MAAVLHSRPAPFRPAHTSRRAGLLVAVALHLAVVAALLSYAPARSALLASLPIMVELITPPKAEPSPPAPPTELPRPRPVARTEAQPRPVEAAPVIAAPSTAPSPVVTAPPPPPVPSPEPVAAVPAPVPVTPPVFGAEYLNNPFPAYPAMSRRLREQGRVVLRVLVNANGTADEVQVRATSGTVRLDESALETVRRWKFVPARRGSEAVPAWVLIPISFKLEG